MINQTYHKHKNVLLKKTENSKYFKGILASDV